MAYYPGDIPSEVVVVEPAREGDPIDLTPFAALDTEVVLKDGEGEVVAADFVVTFAEDGTVELEWPTDASLFDVVGLYTLTITLVGDDARERLPAVYFVVQDEASGWHTVDSARADWTVGEATIDDRRLWQLLELAGEQVIEYASALAEGDPIPARYKAAQLMQAQNLYNAGSVDPATGSTGDDSFVLRPYPLDWMVKQVLRPAAGIPRVG
jgi:hypothetical protein